MTFVMNVVDCRIVRWVSNEPWPGWVEAELVDADGRSWLFVDKFVTFTADHVSPTSAYPIRAEMACEILGEDAPGVLTITTERPFGLDSDGATVFRVSAEQVRQVEHPASE